MGRGGVWESSGEIEVGEGLEVGRPASPLHSSFWELDSGNSGRWGRGIGASQPREGVVWLQFCCCLEVLGDRCGRALCQPPCPFCWGLREL